MGLEFSIDTERQVVVTTAVGVLTDSDMVAAAEGIRRHPKFHADMRGLVDWTGASAVKVSPAMLFLLTGFQAYSAKSRRAFLVQAGLPQGMMEFYRMNVVSGKVEIFTDRAEALAWLNMGVSPEKHIPA